MLNRKSDCTIETGVKRLSRYGPSMALGYRGMAQDGPLSPRALGPGLVRLGRLGAVMAMRVKNMQNGQKIDTGHWTEMKPSCGDAGGTSRHEAQLKTKVDLRRRTKIRINEGGI